MLPIMQPERITPLESGFRAQIKGANLADLIQMECFALSHRVVRISSQGDTGYLFFSGGQIVHAEFLDLPGEIAAATILSWEVGTFDPCERAWPKSESIRCSWQSLIMRAAHARDERYAASEALHAQVLPSVTNEPPFPSDSLVTNEPASTIMNYAQPIISVVAAEAEIAARLAPDGTVLEAIAEGEDFAGTAAYASQLAQLVGGILGMEGFSEMEFEFKKGKCLVMIGRNGDVYAIKPKPEASLPKIREKLALVIHD